MRRPLRSWQPPLSRRAEAAICTRGLTWVARKGCRGRDATWRPGEESLSEAGWVTAFLSLCARVLSHILRLLCVVNGRTEKCGFLFGDLYCTLLAACYAFMQLPSLCSPLLNPGHLSMARGWVHPRLVADGVIPNGRVQPWHVASDPWSPHHAVGQVPILPPEGQQGAQPSCEILSARIDWRRRDALLQAARADVEERLVASCHMPELPLEARTEARLAPLCI